jgi:hypothetical protein
MEIATRGFLKKGKLMNYAIEQRMRFIDFLLAHYGTINRSALTDFFGISVPQASKDFKDYLTIAPDNMRYSTSKKVYFKNPGFERVWKES